MSNQGQTDYDRQFQDDLAKATALSLEQQALDDYRRNKKYGTGYHSGVPSGVAARDYYAQQRSQSVTQRRHSEVHTTAAAASNVERSRTPPAQVSANDLICFASPTSKQPESGTTFERLIEDLQRMQPPNPHSQALVPVGQAAAAVPAQYGYPQPQPLPHHQAQTQPPPYGIVGTAGGMQLVPYQNASQAQQRPLSNEELQRLYSMPNQMAVQPVQAVPTAYLYYPGAVVAPYTAPIVPGSAAFMPPQYPQSHGFGFGPVYAGASTHMDLGRPQSTPVPTATSISSHHPSSNPVAHEANGVNIQPRRQVPLGASASTSNSISSNGQPQPPKRTGNDLIDLNQEDYSRVSVLEAFDPLLNENTVSQK
ncbi:vacuolar protein-sorting protein BRO1 isoform X3 [Drosophila obscura]|uniref:vacuolar protein-sorting protein BRO1 isoform X3 n=1 Tax=Drosophila obscura TaxID=7282 RepID=UPI001BB20763|nr:vacuolar protein-sorting protein BRO1 isoform X3 [Drosophila obscura]